MKTLESKETVCQKPLGQRLMDAGFKKITERELSEILKINEIQKMEDDLALQDLEESLKPKLKINQKYGKTIQIYISSYSIYFDAPGRFLKLRDFVCGSKKRKICQVNITSIDNYMDDKIPDSVYDSINKAKDLGVNKFAIAQPILVDVPRSDPVIIGYLGDTMVYIDKWD